MNTDDVLTLREYIFLGFFVLLEFLVPIFVIWASYSERVRFNLTSLWVHQGRIDKLAVIMMFTWWTHTCSMILWTLMLKVATTDYLTYMGWAIPIIAKMFSPNSTTGEAHTAGTSAPATPPPAPLK
jgi:hypothetical protein